MESISQNNACVFVLGPTGIGKTAVSIMLGKNNGEIVNTDAFSLYKEGDIMTAKATKDEQTQIKHHMIDIIDLTDRNYNINSYEKDAKAQIEEIFKSHRTPVIVGGTNYYVERLLFHKEEISPQIDNNEVLSINFEEELKDIVAEIQEIKQSSIEDKDKAYTLINNYLQKIDKQKISGILKKVDEEYFTFYHENDIRRIINAVSFYFAYGYKKSMKVKSQKCTLQYERTKVVILLPEDEEALSKRQSSRADELVQNGIGEIIYIFQTFASKNIEINFNLGILQAIGYKEFYQLFKLLSNEIKEYVLINYKPEKSKEISEKILSVIEEDPNLKKVLKECKAELIKNTVNYGKYQMKWIKKKILPLINGYLTVTIKEYTLDTFLTEYYPKILEYFWSEKFVEITITKESNLIQWKKYYCEICDKKMNGENEYISHLKSNSHKKRKAKKSKKIPKV